MTGVPKPKSKPNSRANVEPKKRKHWLRSKRVLKHPNWKLNGEPGSWNKKPRSSALPGTLKTEIVLKQIGAPEKPRSKPRKRPESKPKNPRNYHRSKPSVAPPRPPQRRGKKRSTKAKRPIG